MSDRAGYLRLSDLRKILSESGLMLTKSLGQNFLHDGNQLDRIVRLAEIVPGDRVLEVGPGMGALTGPLLDAGAHVLAIEKDHRLCDFLTTRRLKGHPRFQLVHEDALERFKSRPEDWTGWKLVANLPYSVGSPIIVELALSQHPPDLMVVTLQLEVIEKAFAAPASPTYGLLSILIQLSYEPVEFFKLPSGCFFPPPDVTSACGLFRRLETPLCADADEKVAVSRLVKTAFRQRRKTMANSLKSLYGGSDAIVAALDAIGHPPMQRPEKLAPAEFVHLTRHLSSGQQ